jgi:5'-methylthioinosine phosphorylase
MSLLAIIGGTGLSELNGMAIERRQLVPTPWGEPSASLLHGALGGRRAVFLPRHGSGHTIPPHEVNYRANVWALREVGADRVVAVNAVGGISDDCQPGLLVIPDQLIDYTWGRHHSYSDGAGRPLRHVDFTQPYSESVRRDLLGAAGRAGLNVRDGGVYGVTQGPRLETAAEIDRMARDGCDLVGMTGMPEAALARELDLDFACCAMVVNRAAGRGEDIHGELDRWVHEGMASVRRLLEALLTEPVEVSA